MTEEKLELLYYTIQKRLQKKKPTPYLCELIAHAINSSTGKTPARRKMLILWNQLRKEASV